LPDTTLSLRIRSSWPENIAGPQRVQPSQGRPVMRAPDLEPDFAEARARTVTLPTSATSPWLSRQLLAQWCREWSVADTAVDEAMVVVSELVTECMAAGAPMFSLRARLGTDQLELAVGGGAAPGAPDSDEDSGHRMQVVRSLGSSVEVRPSAQGRTIVVAVPLSRAP
jgi:hypothetical protein